MILIDQICEMLTCSYKSICHTTSGEDTGGAWERCQKQNKNYNVICQALIKINFLKQLCIDMFSKFNRKLDFAL
jgi:hypothetical protein